MLPALVAIIGGDDPVDRKAALSAARQLPDAGIVGAACDWLEAHTTATPEAQASVLSLLRDREALEARRRAVIRAVLSRDLARPEPSDLILRTALEVYASTAAGDPGLAEAKDSAALRALARRVADSTGR